MYKAEVHSFHLDQKFIKKTPKTNPPQTTEASRWLLVIKSEYLGPISFTRLLEP